MPTGVRARLILYVSNGETDVRKVAGLSTGIPKLSVSYA